MSTVTTDITWEVIEPASGALVESVAFWDSADPFAVYFTFADQASGEPAQWSFARDLLLEAYVNGYAGDCDVKIARMDDRMHLTLDTPDGRIKMSAPLGEIQGFVNETHMITPIGREDASYLVDETIRRLLEDV